jgi:hypothetical protein
MNNDVPKQTHSEKMDALDEMGENIKASLDMALKLHRAGTNAKQVAYWIGKFSHDAAALGRVCLVGASKKKGNIIT